MGIQTARVLVADDDPADRQLLSRIVRKVGYEVCIAVDGDDALAKFRELDPDVVLLDTLMPGLDGLSVAKEIKASTPDRFVPIMFLTGVTEASELARCVDAGGDDFLTKPYNAAILQAKLNALERMREIQHTVQQQRDEISRHHLQLIADQEAAKAVFDNIAHARQLHADFIRQVISPLSLFNGDVVLTAQGPSDNVYVMLGDFTGHGLAAAIGALPLADVFYGMTAKGFLLKDIARECNRKLGAVLPTGYFCCATLIAVDCVRGSVEFWNGGLPSVYLRRVGDDQGETLARLESSHLPLGILKGDDFSDATQVIEVQTGDKVFLATDGVVESRDDAGEYFSDIRLEQVLAYSDPGNLLHAVQEAVKLFVGSRDRDDDVTIVEIEIVPSAKLRANPERKSVAHPSAGPRDWKLTYELGPESLRDFNPLPILQHVMMEAPYLHARTSEIYTVLAELYSNALEHGVLGLDSTIKNSATGFARYYDLRAAALNAISGFVRFEIAGRCQDRLVRLSIGVCDSGRGFDYEKMLGSQGGSAGANSYHGRGLTLLSRLCDTIEFTAPGNRVDVVMSWDPESTGNGY